jgi:GDP-L-fucose synthase
MIVLVTGGSGLVGSAIKNIYPNFIYISSSDVNLINYEDTLRFFNKVKPTHVIHLAATVGGLFKNIRNNVEMFENNIYINTNVIKCAYKVGVKKLVACLSTCVYPDEVTYPITEDQFHNGEPHSSNFGYAYAKRMLEVQCRSYNELYNTDYICVIPTNIYGPNDNFSITDGHVIPALIHKFHVAKLENKEIILPGSGIAKRQFISSDKVAKIITSLLFIDKLDNNTIFNVCEDESYEITISELVKKISKIFNYYNYKFDNYPHHNGQLIKTASNKKIKEVLPYLFLDIDDFDKKLKETVDWFLYKYT